MGDACNTLIGDLVLGFCERIASPWRVPMCSLVRNLLNIKPKAADAVFSHTPCYVRSRPDGRETPLVFYTLHLEVKTKLTKPSRGRVKVA